MSALWLGNGLLRLGFVPGLGGRLLSVRLGDTELLWHNASLLDSALNPVGGHVFRPNSGRMGDWVNYGGDKTWPAPQGWDRDGQWPGPPDPVLDSGPYTVDSLAANTVTLTSAADPRTGLRIARRCSLPPGRAGYRLRLTATNVSDRTVRWSLWNVTQFPGGGDVLVGLRAGRTPAVVELVAGTGNPRYEPIADGRVRVPNQDVVGKLGFPGATGWVAYAAAGYTATLSFAVDETGEYPDLGSPLEVWLEHPLPAPLAALGGLDPPARIVECEVLGPLTELAPGASTSLTIDADFQKSVTPTWPGPRVRDGVDRSGGSADTVAYCSASCARRNKGAWRWRYRGWSSSVPESSAARSPTS